MPNEGQTGQAAQAAQGAEGSQQAQQQSGTAGQAGGTGQAAQGQAAQQAAPQIDAAALQTMVDKSIKDGLTNLAQQAQQRQAPQQTQQQADPLTQMIAPIVGPAMQQIGMRAEGAMDAATFYAAGETSPEMTALRAKHQAKVEEVFNRELQAGRFTSRASIWSYLKGGELYGEAVEAEIAARARKQREAEMASTAGAGSPHLPSSQSRQDPYEMKPEDLDKQLQNIQF